VTSLDLTGKPGKAPSAPTGSALPLILVAFVAAVVMLIAFLFARDLSGKGAAQQGSRPSA